MMRLAILASLLALPAGAQVYTGAYALAELGAQACAPNSDARIEVQSDRILYYESMCLLLDPQPLQGMGGAVLYRLQCTGEGETWTDAAILMQAEGGGLYSIRAGRVFEYQPCR